MTADEILAIIEVVTRSESYIYFLFRISITQGETSTADQLLKAQEVRESNHCGSTPGHAAQFGGFLDGLAPAGSSSWR